MRSRHDDEASQHVPMSLSGDVERLSSGHRLTARGIRKIFSDGKRKVEALGPVDFSIDDGSFVCIVGPSGCGKSTLLRMIAGLISPTEGEIRIAQRDSSRALSAMVFQDHSLFPWKTVRQNVALGLDIRKKLTSQQKRERIDHWLETFLLHDFADAYPNTLSGGMRQRLSIARAFAVEPELLLMDEPFASLDAQLRLAMQLELVRLWESDRRTVVFITHSIDEAILLGDRILVMTARPGQICSDLPVPFPRPRGFATRSTPEFGALEQQIWNLLRQDLNHDSEAPAREREE